MPKKSHITIARVSMLIIVGLAVFAPMAHAQETTILKFLGFDLWDLVAEVLAVISQWALSIMVLWVSITGALLNVSIVLTLHIKDFVNSVQGVYLVWQTIRDISGLFIIFMLLYASFKMILGFDSVGGVGNLIKNIVIAGILINFSFFITSLLIDASNIVSLALYNGIVAAPSQTSGANASINPQQIVQSEMNSPDGGLSGLFMKYIAPQDVISPSTIKLGTQPVAQSSGASKPLEILIQGIVGCIIMFTSGMSFLLAALAFVARLAILIFLLAFSPIWFAAMIFPILKSKADEFTQHLKEQLIFMPIYLLLMYAALKVLSSSTIFTNPATNVFQGSNGLTTTVWTNLMVLAINDFFILFLLNMPLITAFGFGGMATDWLKGAVNKVGAANVWKNIGGFAGRNTIGHIAYNADEALAKTRLGNMALGRDFRLATTGALAKAKMGGDLNYEDVRTRHADVVRRAAANKRLSNVKSLIAQMDKLDGKAPDYLEKYNKLSADLDEDIKVMGGKEKLELSPDIWQNKEFLKYVDDSDYKAFRKSDRVEDTEVIKEKVKQIRRNAVGDALSKGQDDAVEHMFEEMDGHELIKQAGRTYVNKEGKTVPVMTSPEFIKNLTQAHLRGFDDEKIEDTLKKEIGRQINGWKVKYKKNHQAFGFVTRKDNEEWLPEELRGTTEGTKELRIKPTRK
jgi:hypothetical protein